jgi:hypothetical protein
MLLVWICLCAFLTPGANAGYEARGILTFMVHSILAFCSDSFWAIHLKFVANGIFTRWLSFTSSASSHSQMRSHLRFFESKLAALNLSLSNHPILGIPVRFSIIIVIISTMRMSVPMPTIPLLLGKENLAHWEEAVHATLQAHGLDQFVRYFAAIDYYDIIDEDKAEKDQITDSLAIVRKWIIHTGWDIDRRDNPAELFQFVKVTFTPGIAKLNVWPIFRKKPAV